MHDGAREMNTSSHATFVIILREAYMTPTAFEEITLDGVDNFKIPRTPFYSLNAANGELAQKEPLVLKFIQITSPVKTLLIGKERYLYTAANDASISYSKTT
jgi:hypothetical protein